MGARGQCDWGRAVNRGTHVVAGLTGYTAVSLLSGWAPAVGPLAVAAAASMLPDVDSPKSLIGRAVGPLSRQIESRWGHRTATHSYAAQALLYVALLPVGLVWGWWAYYWAGVLGYALHVILDTATVQGVRVWWPWSTRRGVFPFDAAHPEQYRLHTGGFGDRALGIGLAAILGVLLIIQVQGYERLLRLARADVVAAVRDVRAWESEALLAVELEALHAISQEPLSGTFPIVGAPSDRLLLIRGRDGNVYGVGHALEAHYQGRRVVVRRGTPMSTRTLTLDMAGRLLADLPSMLPSLPDGSEVEFFGTLTPLSPVALTRDAWRYNVITGGSVLRFDYAALTDIEARGLAGVMIRDGSLTARILVPRAAAGAGEVGGGSVSLARPVRFSFGVEASADVRVSAGDSVSVGDTLAVVLDPAVERAGEALGVVELAITAQRATMAAAADERARRIGDAEERAAVARVRVDLAAAEHSRGYSTDAALERARIMERTAADELRALRSAPAGGAVELARLEAEEARKRADLARLRARAAILAPVGGMVRSVNISEREGRQEGTVVIQSEAVAADTAGTLVL